MAKKDKKASSINIQQFPMTVMPIDRNRRELQDWRRGMNAAESLTAPQRKTLYDLYANAVLDLHLTAVMGKRKLAVTNIDWSIVDKDGNVIEDLTKALDSTFFEDILNNILDARFYGFSLQQIDWINKIVELVPRAHVNPADKIVLANPLIWSQGIVYNEPPYTGMCLETGKPDDLGLLLKVTPFTILKRNDIADWAAFCELFGSPLRVVHYDPNTPGNRVEAEKAMQEMGAAGYIVLPDGSTIEFPQTNAQTGNETYDRFAEFCNKEISKGVVTQTMTTEDGASLSQSEVHMEAEERVNQSDIRYVRRLLNERLIPIMIAQGVSLPEGAHFQPIEEEQTLSKKDRLDMDLQIHREVGRIPKSYFVQEYNVEFVDASDDEKLNSGTVQQPEPTPTKAQKKTATKGKEVKVNNSEFAGWFQNFIDFFAQAPRN